jgi:hypothetical protein
LTGYTNVNGEFSYKIDDTVSFYINDLLLGDVEGSNLITPADITNELYKEDVNGYSIKTKNMLVLLQSLDKDNNADNGINLTYLDKNISFDNIDLWDNTTITTKIMQLNNELNTSLHQVSIQSAVKHMSETLDIFKVYSFENTFSFYDYQDNYISIEVAFTMINNNIIGKLKEYNNNYSYMDESYHTMYESFSLNGKNENGKITIYSQVKNHQYIFTLNKDQYGLVGEFSRSDMGDIYDYDGLPMEVRFNKVLD